jgi:uncharacterized protein
MISPSLVQAILRQYHLPLTGIHGPVHWARVLENGIRLAETTGARRPVVELFTVFHDACRLNEDWDPMHGSRGADLAESFRGKFFDLDDHDLIALKVACRLHTQGMTEGDVTVQTCWDADRLDLGRIGVKPNPEYLCTAVAKSRDMIEWAHDRASAGTVPNFIHTLWGLSAVVPS